MSRAGDLASRATESRNLLLGLLSALHDESRRGPLDARERLPLFFVDHPEQERRIRSLIDAQLGVDGPRR